MLIPRKELKETPEDAYGEAQRPMKAVIADLQKSDQLVAEHKSKVGPKAEPSNWSFDNDGLLRHHSQVYVPGDEAIREELISRCHDDALSGHFGCEKTVELLRRKYCWPGCNEQVRENVLSCDVRQRVKVHRHRPYSELQSLPQPKSPWQELSMDFITGLPPEQAVRRCV